MLANYTTVDHFNLTSDLADTTAQRITKELEAYDLVLVGVHLSSILPGAKYGIKAKTVQLLKNLTATKKTVVTVLGNPYSLGKLEGLEDARALVLGYQLTTFTEELSAQLLFGAIPAKGKLPVTVNERYKLGDGMVAPAIARLKYTIPEEVGIDSRFLTAKVDSLVKVGLTEKAYPGCVVQMAKDGKVILRKAYGTHTYEGLTPTKLDDLFDFASVTKIAASTLSLMRLVDAGQFDVNKTMGDYLPEYRKSNKANLVWRDVLTHQAGLKAWIPFWMDTRNPDGTWKARTFSNEKRGPYKTEV